MGSKENLEILKNIFQAKRVPLDFITKIKNYREFHRPDFASVKDTVKTTERLKEFDFYFEYVIKKLNGLESSGVV